MVSNWSAGRAALVARSRFYLAVVATGGMAVGGALTIAAADVPTTTQAQQQPASSHRSAHRSAHRAARRSVARQSATSPVRAVHHAAAQPTATTHAS